MQLITDKKPHRIIPSEGKYIRHISDVYEPEHKDEEGNILSEHFPHHMEIIYVPDKFTEEEMNKLYVEEDIEEN